LDRGPLGKTAAGILIIAALAALIALVFNPLRQSILAGLVAARDSCIALAEARFDKKIFYEGMGPSIFGTLDLRGVSIYEGNEAPEKGERALATIERVRVEYSLWDLIRGRPESAVSSVTVDRPIVTINSNAEFVKVFTGEVLQDGAERAPAAAREEDLVAGLCEFMRLLPEGFNVRVRWGMVRVFVAGSRFSLSSFSLNASVDGEGLSFNANWKAEATGDDAGKESFFIAVPGSAEGRFDFASARGDVNVLFPETVTETFALRRTRILASLAENRLTARKIDDDLPYDVSFAVDFNRSSLEAELSARDFSFATVITLKGRLAQYNSWLAARWTGGGSFEATGDGALAYKADFTGSLPPGYPVGGGFFELSASGNEKSVRINNVKLALSRGTISYRGGLVFDPVSPNGVLKMEGFYLGKNGKDGTSTPVTGELIFSSGARRMSVFASELRFADSVLSAFDVEALRSGGNWALSLSALRYNNVGSDKPVSVSRIKADANVNLNARTCSAVGRVESLALSDLINIAGSAMEFPQRESVIQNFADDIYITTEASFTTNFVTMSYKIPHLVCVYRGFTDIISVSSLSGSDKMFELSDCHIAAGGGIDIAARADYSNMNNVSFLLESTINKTPYRFEGSFTNNKNIALTGSYVNGSAVLNKNGSFDGSLTVDSLLLPSDAKNSVLSVSSTFSYASKNRWNVNIDAFDINDIIYRPENSSSVHLSGTVNQDRAYLPELLFDDGKDPLRGEAQLSFRAHAELEGDDATMPELLVNLANLDGTEKLSAQGRLHAGSFDAHIEANAFRVYRFFHNSTDMAANGVLDFSLESGGVFNAAFNLESAAGHIAGKEILLAFKGSLNAEKAEIAEAFLSYAGFTVDFPFVSIDRKQSSFETTARLHRDADAENFYADAHIQGAFGAAKSWQYVPKALREFSGLIDVSNVSFLSSAALNEFSVQFSRLENMIRVSGGPQDMIDAQIDAEGSFYASLSAPSPLMGTFFGEIKEDKLDVNASNLYVDIEKLWRIFPKDAVIAGVGGFVLADIRITGSLSDPNIFGVANGYDVRMRVPEYLPGEVGPAPVTVHLEGKKMFFDPIAAPAGEGGGYITGSFYFDRWVPSNYEIAVVVNPDRAIPYSFNLAGIESSGLASGTIAFTMDNHNLLISGALTGSDSTITVDAATPEERQARFLALNKDPNLYTATDLRINADRGVEFLWPSADYPILRTNLDIGDTLHITSDSLSGKSTLAGNIGLRGGELFYFQRNFYIKSGQLVFNENEVKFEPRISAVAETHDQSDEGPVTISIVINDQSINSFTPIIRSDPPLSQVAILSILGNTMSGTPDDESNTIARPFLASTTDVLAQFQVVRRVERRLRDILHVDIFSARTQALQNALFQAAFSTSEEGEPAIWSYFDNTTILLGKYLTPNLFLRSMIAASYDKNKLKNDGLSFDLSIGVELTSPLFIVRAEVNPFPSTFNTASLLMPDTSITLSRTWRLP
jgi:hypothetical protein